jgi:hypothetical protein
MRHVARTGGKNKYFGRKPCRKENKLENLDIDGRMILRNR